MRKFVVAYEVFPGCIANCSFTAGSRFTANIKAFIIARGKTFILEEKKS